MSDWQYKYTLPYPPTINHYYGVRGKSRYIKMQGKVYREEVSDIVEDIGLDCPIYLKAQFWMPDRRRRDLDNLGKCLLDAMESAGLFLDDSQISKLTFEKCGFEKGGRCEITVRPYPADKG